MREIEEYQKIRQLLLEYQETLQLLTGLKDKIADGQISLSDLGENFIDEFVKAGFNVELPQEKKESELASIEAVISGLQKKMLCVKSEEKKMLAKLRKMQEAILPYKQEQLEQENVRHIWMDVRELFLQQNASITGMDYQRLDVIVKYLAIENYFHKNDYGFDMYHKLQEIRLKQSYDIPEGYHMLAEYLFSDLIQSVDERGFLEESEIICDSRLLLMDGAHRLALCLYYGIPKVRVMVLERQRNVVPFTLDYLRKGGFSEKECSVIEKKARELLDKCRINTVCILSSPADSYFNQITQDIGNACKVIGCRNVRQARVLQLEIWAPYFRLDDEGNAISTVAERLEKLVWERYGRLTEACNSSVMITVGKNFKQCEDLMEIDIHDCVLKNTNSIRAYFGLIKELEPEKILDVGMLLKRIGSCTRAALQCEICDEIELVGIDLFPEIQFEAWNKTYDTVWNFHEFLAQNRDDYYDLVFLLDIREIINIKEQKELCERIRGRAKYILTDDEYLVSCFDFGKKHNLTIGGVSYFLLQEEAGIYGN